MNKNVKIAKILLPLPFSEGFDYSIPEEISLEKNDLVFVPFGKKIHIGLVLDILEIPKPEFQLKPIKNTLKNENFELQKFSDEFVNFLKKQAEYYLTPLGKVFALTISEKFFKKVKERKAREKPLKTFNKAEVQLNDEQKEVYDFLLEKLQKNDFSVCLLDGITGSGKTEVYFEIVKRNLEEGRQSLILLPEILLSTQIIKRFENSFNQTPVIWHSEVTEAQKRKNYFRIASGEAKIVIGARSALHLPYKNLAIIICDEEHDNSYKQEEQTIYNARDMAILRCSLEKTLCILASATPSIETYFNAIKGKYHHLKLSSRYSKISLPEAEIIDMREEKLPAKYFISERVKQEIIDNISNNLQTLLFLNRRGYAPLLLCGKCGFRFESPDTSSWLVLHKNEKGEFYLECHHTGFRMPLPSKCPACQTENSFRSCGPGVQRLSEEVKEIFPNARIAELSSDSFSSFKKAQEFIQKIEAGEVDIIIGTQIIAKGHHFPNLKSVAIIDADLGLDFTDLRASEKVFQVLHQVSGRAGRENIKGKVLIQSYLPNNPVIKTIAANDRDRFLSLEIAERENSHLPPFSRLVAIIISSENDIQAMEFASLIVKNFEQINEVEIFGASKAIFHRYRGEFRYRILLKSAKNFKLQNYINNSLQKIKTPKNIKVKIDVDPYSFS
ncbi:MAG: primosomal protein N' [Rickettsiales bacterium]|nr:primosomal protein N' [Rickettsiales bacterium]